MTNLIKGISPITNQPFDKSDAENYGSLVNSEALFEKYKNVDAFDYIKLEQDFLEFKKHNPDLIEIPATKMEVIFGKALSASSLKSLL